MYTNFSPVNSPETQRREAANMTVPGMPSVAELARKLNADPFVLESMGLGILATNISGEAELTEPTAQPASSLDIDPLTRAPRTMDGYLEDMRNDGLLAMAGHGE